MTQIIQARKPVNAILFMILGAVFWFEALLCIRFGGESLFVDGNPWLLLLFVASIPVAGVLVKVSAVISKVDRADLFSAVAIMALTATLLDGVALTWFPGWYGLTRSGLLLAAAWLLWGVGVSLGVGYWASRSLDL
ncbi:DUF5367 family protein [Chamaesiphon sp. VAR_48_metabat_403]|uniref:DUF5367 family protein n=1 Tax=Chamaesiphon sp. VAR_48_metabat_403 TaxID=2964700 RepID=UPI00286E1EDF|nr:DUF5367 family protein [Chamaesiphon sp. VAR_48_metabat_403]